MSPPPCARPSSTLCPPCCCPSLPSMPHHQVHSSTLCSKYIAMLHTSIRNHQRPARAPHPRPPVTRRLLLPELGREVHPHHPPHRRRLCQQLQGVSLQTAAPVSICVGRHERVVGCLPGAGLPCGRASLPAARHGTTHFSRRRVVAEQHLPQSGAGAATKRVSVCASDDAATVILVS